MGERSEPTETGSPLNSPEGVTAAFVFQAQQNSTLYDSMGFAVASVRSIQEDCALLQDEGAITPSGLGIAGMPCPWARFAHPRLHAIAPSGLGEPGRESGKYAQSG